MNLTSDNKYAKLTDREIINSIITQPYNEEAAACLLYECYTPKFRKLCKDIHGTFEVYYDCVDDLFLYLKGKELNWDKLRSFYVRKPVLDLDWKNSIQKIHQNQPLLIEMMNKISLY